MTTLWIVDDEPHFALGLQEAFEADGMAVRLCPTVAALRSELASAFPDIVLLDQRLPDGLGVDQIGAILESAPEARVILMTAYGEADLIVQAIRRGAFNYLDKPFPLAGVRRMVRQAEESLALGRQALAGAYRPSSPLIGSSRAMRAVGDTIEKLKGQSDLNLLLLGESGTGKEVAARVIHEQSGAPGASNASKSFIAINCAAIPEALLEAELFGFRKGAYTGADEDKTGLIEVADGGTLFLDEIGDMALSLQSKLLRFLDSRSLRPLGASVEKTVSLNIICATSADLSEAVAKGTFRKDLYYRIGVVPITMPPLRERGDDAQALAEHFIAHFARKRLRKPRRLSEEVAAFFRSYDWPGNVRELKNLMERLTILAPGDGGDILLKDLPEEMSSFHAAKRASGLPPGASLPERLEAFERTCLVEALEANGQNRNMTAESLGISRFSLLRRMQKHGLA